MAMWLVTFSNASEFEWAIAAFSIAGDSTFEKVVTSAGGHLARAASPSAPFHLALVSDDPTSTRNLLTWAQRELHPSVFVSSGSVLACGDSWDPEQAFVPQTCYRSAGRLDFGGGSPVLFEEIAFDTAIQKQIADGLPTVAGPRQVGLFSASRPISSQEERAWLGARLNCQAVDSHTAEILLAGRHLGIPTGCVKALAGPSSTEVLKLALTRAK